MSAQRRTDRPLTRLAMARRERAELAEFLAGLSAEQWAAASLCEGWSVRDVVAHMICYDVLSWPQTLKRLARVGFNLNRGNAVELTAADALGPDEVLARLENQLTPRGLTAVFGGMPALLDGLIHHQDIRRPLGLPREIPTERLETALRLSLWAPPVNARWRGRGLRLEASDCDFSHGRGPTVRGPGEALLMTLAGRAGIAGELSGPGQPILARRVEGRPGGG